MLLKGRVALVTGSGKGIGKEIAMTLARNGADVVVNDINLEDAEKTAEEIKALGVNAIAIKAFANVYSEVEKMFTEIENEFGKLDILVNNAGITRDGMLMKLSLEKWDQVMDVNLKSVFICSQLAAKIMSKQNSGKIISISSLAGQVGNIGQTNYSASKAGIIGMTKTMAKELAKYNINVNAVAPGFIETDMTAVLPEKVKEKFIQQIPLRRAGKPENIADVVKFLASEEASYVTGQLIAVNGGLVV